MQMSLYAPPLRPRKEEGEEIIYSHEPAWYAAFGEAERKQHPSGPRKEAGGML